MLEELKRWPNKLKDGLQLAQDFHFEYKAQLLHFNNIKKIVFIGMGGSGIAGRIIKTFLDKKCLIPSFVVDGPEMPAWVDANTLVFVVSYSGNTWETLQVLDSLVGKFIPTIVLAHGGKALDIAQSKNMLYIILPESLTPRSSLGVVLGVLLGLFDLMGIFSGKKVLDIFDKQAELYVPKFADDSSYFKEFLDAANGCEGFQIWGVSGDSAAFAYRAQTQFNENSKIHAVSCVFPELNHNMIVGFADCKKKPLILWLSTEFMPPQLSITFEILCELLREKGVILYKAPILGDTWEGQLFHIILWADFASYYLGKLRGVEIAANKMIDELKARLTK